MTGDEEILLKRVDENPEDDTLRLVYADAVQERGDADLAALIRVGVRCRCVKERHLDRPFAEWFPEYHCSTCYGHRWVRRCEHEGCREGGFGCYLPAWENDTTLADGFYCGTHAPEHGFCARCGAFSAGIESFEVSASGLCDGCQSDAEEENEEHYRDDDFDDSDIDLYHDEF